VVAAIAAILKWERAGKRLRRANDAWLGGTVPMVSRQAVGVGCSPEANQASRAAAR
jgi:hypothetical protein